MTFRTQRIRQAHILLLLYVLFIFSDIVPVSRLTEHGYLNITSKLEFLSKNRTGKLSYNYITLYQTSGYAP